MSQKTWPDLWELWREKWWSYRAEQTPQENENTLMFSEAKKQLCLTCKVFLLRVLWSGHAFRTLSRWMDSHFSFGMEQKFGQKRLIHSLRSDTRQLLRASADICAYNECCVLETIMSWWMKFYFYFSLVILVVTRLFVFCRFVEQIKGF